LQQSAKLISEINQLNQSAKFSVLLYFKWQALATSILQWWPCARNCRL